MSTTDLDTWLDEHQPAVERVTLQALQAGITLDLTADSLTSLIEWLLPRMQRRKEDDPIDTAPEWSRWYRYAKYWTDDTLSLLQDAAHYYGAVLQRSVPSARWVTGHDRHAGYIDEGQIVLDIAGHPVSTIDVITNCAAAVFGGVRPADRLRSAHDFTVKHAQRDLP